MLHRVMTIIVSGRSKKGKSRIKQHGAAWRVVQLRQRVLFSDKPGPWLMVVPVGHGDTSKSMRWIHEWYDGDFEVISKKENYG